jgi:hypothetical protein
VLLMVINVRNGVTSLYPSPAVKQPDAKTYDTCPGPIDLKRRQAQA